MDRVSSELYIKLKLEPENVVQFEDIQTQVVVKVDLTIVLNYHKFRLPYKRPIPYIESP